jgi:hypothetical protein
MTSKRQSLVNKEHLLEQIQRELPTRMPKDTPRIVFDFARRFAAQVVVLNKEQQTVSVRQAQLVIISLLLQSMERPTVNSRGERTNEAAIVLEHLLDVLYCCDDMLWAEAIMEGIVSDADLIYPIRSRSKPFHIKLPSRVR